MIGHKRHDLLCVIGKDLLYYNKLQLLILILVILSAVLVVVTTHQTRQLITIRERLISDENALDIEWRNLILEENALGDYNRVEHFATEKLHMQYLDLFEENILIQS